MEPPTKKHPAMASGESNQSILLKLFREKDEQIRILRKELEGREHDITNVSNTIKQISKDLSKVENEIDVEKIKCSEFEKQIEWKPLENGDEGRSNQALESEMEVISEGEEGEIVKIRESPVEVTSFEKCDAPRSAYNPDPIQIGSVGCIRDPDQLPKEVNPNIQNRKRKLNEPSLNARTGVNQFGAKAVENGKMQISKQTKVLPTLPALVFQFQSTQIKMAMFKEGESKILENASGSLATPFVVGLTPNGSFKCGEEVAEKINPPHSGFKECWWVTDHLIKSGDEAWFENIFLPDGHTHQITVEFLIGFILKRLKSHIEVTLNGTCSVAVITVPVWYSSTQRIQVKDGARLAGFTEVNLINEASASVFACPSISKTMLTSRNLLVLSENSGQIDASIYSFTSYPYGKKRLVTIGHSGHYSEIGSRRSEVNVRKTITSEDKEKLVQKICKEALQSMQNLKYNTVGDTSHPVELIVFAESKNWKPILEQVGKQFVNVLFHINKEYDPLVGAAFLSSEPCQIGRIISDKLAHDVFIKCDNERSNITVIAKADFMLPVHSEVVTHSLPLHCKLVKIFQMSTNGPIEILKLSIHPSTYPNQRFAVKLRVANEGIVEMAGVSYLSSTCRSTFASTSDNARKEDYSWTTPNLTTEVFERVKALLEYFANRTVTQDGSYTLLLHPLTQAKEILLLQCKQITGN